LPGISEPQVVDLERRHVLRADVVEPIFSVKGTWERTSMFLRKNRMRFRGDLQPD
jgi:hypothetical protein